LGSDPANPNFSIRDMALPGGVDGARFATRQKLRDIVGRHFQRMDDNPNLQAMDEFYKRAYELVSSTRARAAFDISAEAADIREDYGRNEEGKRQLRARRLVESGVRLVTLNYGGWDMHAKITDGIGRTLPAFDQAFATLIRDLERRGLLDSTLVMVSSEFGRTPKINKDAGRDHWPKVFSIVLAGGGMKRGLVYGASDSIAAEPADNPLTVEDLATTVYHCLGIVADKELVAPGNRPVEIVDGGTVRKDLLA
ncbi:MAG: DUF1501 domain-containing protein, partial [Planctomycetia bacterium]